MLKAERIIELREEAARHEHPEEMLVDVMHEAQDAYGYLSDEAVGVVAGIIGVSAQRVDQLATFYNLFYRRPVGRRVIHVCDSISCWAMGADDIVSYLKRKLGIEMGGTSADGAFTLLPIVCLGACHEAPAMMVGEIIYGNLTPEKIDRILEKEKNNN
ncbi:MAG TPA: NADH-quinone oxidoreductase subunit NuoE [Nitrospirota bacterium]